MSIAHFGTAAMQRVLVQIEYQQKCTTGFRQQIKYHSASLICVPIPHDGVGTQIGLFFMY